MKNMTYPDALLIDKILSILDTRQYEEINDKWVPIPGSGKENQCFRCGKLHEVHATVRLSDGREVVVGTGCAGRDNAEMDAKFRSLGSAANRLAKLKSEYAAFQSKVTVWESAWNAVTMMAVPAVVEGVGVRAVGRESGSTYATLNCGDATIPCWISGITQERKDCVVNVWKQNRMKELGFGYRPIAFRNFQREISKLEKKTIDLTKPRAEMDALKLA